MDLILFSTIMRGFHMGGGEAEHYRTTRGSDDRWPRDQFEPFLLVSVLWNFCSSLRVWPPGLDDRGGEWWRRTGGEEREN